MSKQATYAVAGLALVVAGFLWWRSRSQAAVTAQAVARARAAEAESAKRKESPFGSLDLGPFVEGGKDAAAAAAAFLGSSEFQDALGTSAEVAGQLAAAGTESFFEALGGASGF